MPMVYLAGPIAGLSYDYAESWRHAVRGALAPSISCFSPLRGKNVLRSVGKIGTAAIGADVTPLATDRGIMTRDHSDCMRCDLIFCNLLGVTRASGERPSLGSVMEIAWAFAYRKPLIVLMEPADNLHDHPMIREAIGYRVTSLSDAIDLTRWILLPDATGVAA